MKSHAGLLSVVCVAGFVAIAACGTTEFGTGDLDASEGDVVTPGTDGARGGSDGNGGDSRAPDEASAGDAGGPDTGAGGDSGRDAGIDAGSHGGDSGKDGTAHGDGAPPPVDAGHPKDAALIDSGPKHDAASAKCPSSFAMLGAVCDFSDGFVCEYPAPQQPLDPAVPCNYRATCSGGTWSVQVPALSGCGTANGANCPMAYDDFEPYGSGSGSGATCSALADNCFYKEARCSCTKPTTFTWTCDVPAPAGSCPIPRPALGSPCSQVGQMPCNYGACGGAGATANGVFEACIDGFWQEPQTAGCSTMGSGG